MGINESEVDRVLLYQKWKGKLDGMDVPTGVRLFTMFSPSVEWGKEILENYCPSCSKKCGVSEKIKGIEDGDFGSWPDAIIPVKVTGAGRAIEGEGYVFCSEYDDGDSQLSFPGMETNKGMKRMLRLSENSQQSSLEIETYSNVGDKSLFDL